MATFQLPQAQARNGEAAQTGHGDDILEAATAIFAQRGYRNTDVQVIADELGIGKGSIYRKFPTKRELFLAAADRGMRLLNQTVNAAIKDIADPLDQMAAAIRAYLEFFAANPQFAELLIQERAEFRDRSTPTYFVHREANLDRWKRLYRRLMAEGRVRRMPIERLTDALSGMVYGTMFINFFTGRKKSSAAQAADILDMVFHGMLTPQEQARRQRKGGRR